MSATEYRLGYRGDVEGLRAIAILLVVAAHAKVTWLAGGFIGVDVFFVLSGYLITGVLLREIEQTGHLQFAKFYARRFRRLLPALLVMIAATSIAAIVLLPPGEQAAQAIGAATAAVWSSNLHFAFARLDYFSPGAASNLFLHTWSLGVEEQFYLVWPALLVGLLMLGKANGVKRVTRLKTGMLAIGAASLIACLLTTRSAPQMAYYLMPLRAWQFAVGALVWLHSAPAQVAPSGEPTRLRLFAYRWCGWLGLCVILIAGVRFDTQSTYPGWRALLPTLGAAAIIMAGSRDATGASSCFLCWRPLQAVGHISYSWYLWHWPVLLLGSALLTTHQGAAYRALLIALSLALAAASYRWVEGPIRQQARWIARPGITVAGAIVLMLITNVLCITWFNSAAKWLQSPAQQRYAKARMDAPIIYTVGCDDWYHSATLQPCWFGPREAKHTVVLLGDSVGAQWFPAVATVFDKQPDWRLLVLTKSSCPMVDEPFFYARIGRDYTECRAWRRRALDEVASLHPELVILGSVETYPFTQAQWIQGTVRVLSAISGASGHVYLLRATPQLPFNGPSCLAAHHWMPWLHSHRGACEVPSFSQHANDVFTWLSQAGAGFANVSMLDLNDVVCPQGVCFAERDNIVVFRDSQHITATFAESLGAEFGKRLLKPSGALLVPETRNTHPSRNAPPPDMPPPAH
ncbi:MAG: acyltransferase family protein [Rhodanobacter sp.]